jgi:hypothetical protein
MYVFRSGRRVVCGEELLSGLRRNLSRLAACSMPAANGGGFSESFSAELIDVLLRAGEIECALADAEGDDERLAAASRITDALADCLVRETLEPYERALRTLARLSVPPKLWVSPPEGFAYYGLHPLDYASLAVGLCDRENAGPGNGPSHRRARALVIGIRSIGTTLSAVVSAALRGRGLGVERMTVRPEGHPFDRRCRWNARQLQAILSQLQASDQFFVVDEGPGLSGSSFLSVAEALVAVGVARADITLLCGHMPDPLQLRAPGAQHRWNSFRSFAVSCGERRPADAARWIGGGAWRSLLMPPNDAGEIEWPAAWTQMERAKYLTADGRAVLKFEGLGRYGKEVAGRSEQLAETGFSPRLLRSLDAHGYAGYERIDGLSIGAERSGAHMPKEEELCTLAEYCGLRVKEFKCDLPGSASDEISLTAMCAVNARNQFGIDLDIPPDFLIPEHPVIADGRMMPSEWMLTTSGGLVKTDGASHGDDHFFPGPCDIAWDLAGVIIEWGLSADAAAFFLEAYRHASGDNSATRLKGYLMAYALFRMGYCKMAAEAMQGSGEEARLRKAFAFYREVAGGYVERCGFAIGQRAEL